MVTLLEIYQNLKESDFGQYAFHSNSSLKWSNGNGGISYFNNKKLIDEAMVILNDHTKQNLTAPANSGFMFFSCDTNVQQASSAISNTSTFRNPTSSSFFAIKSLQNTTRQSLHDEEIVEQKLAQRIPVRVQLSAAIEEAPAEEVTDFYSRFQHSQSDKNIHVTVPKQYTVQNTVQMNQQTVTFEVKTVIGDGDCGYTAFGITRLQAYQLLVAHLNEVGPIVKPALQEALRTQAFIDTLQREGRLTRALSDAYTNYLQASHGREMPQQVLNTLDRAGEDLTILLAYIDYDVKAKQIDQGWSHPCILFALAEIQEIELHIWRCNEEALVPHAEYPQHMPAQTTTRTDLLFVNNNHFERLELIDNNAQLIAQPSNTNSL